MSSSELRAKWDHRYRDADPADAHPAPVLTENAALLPDSGRALELACGLGGNAQWLARRGMVVDAWDVSPVAIAKLKALSVQENLPISPRVEDIEQKPPPEAVYDLVVVTNFLDRELAGAMAESIKPGGLLAYQTFTKSPSRSHGPGNPDFLLDRNELLRLFAHLTVVAYREEDQVGAGQSPLRGEAWLLAQRQLE
jgi:tellurite methyltransferase